MKPETKTAAILHARANVVLSNMGRQWRVDTYSPAHRAWRQGTPGDYWQARANYAQALIDRARAFQDRPLLQYEGGPWTGYL